MRTPADSADPAGPVLFFDGECGLCHRVVRLLLRLDRRGLLHFAPLQGLAGQAYLRRHGLDPFHFDSLVFVPEWSRRDRPEFLLRTDGIVAALKQCGGLGTGLAAFGLLPKVWRDAGYRWIARWRYRLFGRWRARPLANPAWEARFLS